MELTTAALILIGSALVIAVAGTALAKTADQLADMTGWGEALFGAVFLGGATSLPGIITSVVAAYENHPQLAMSNAIGGIAAQTLFLSIADIFYRKHNLEHAAASFANLMQGVLLVGMLAIVLTAASAPKVTLFHIHPASLVLIVVYMIGFRFISKASERPMWKPLKTSATLTDVPDQKNIAHLNLTKTALKFTLLALIVGATGYAVAKTGIIIAKETGFSETFVGMLFTAVATSLPELIVSIAAVRQRALTLAVSNIIGGNSFDVLFVAFADVAYFEGSILHAVSSEQTYMLSLTLLMTAVLIMGLLQREEKGIGKIGWESLTIIVLYLLGNAWIFWI